TIALTRLPARIAGSPPRFDAGHVLATKLRAPRPNDGWRGFHDDLGRALAGVSGVRGVAFGTAHPLGDQGTSVTSVTTTEQRRQSLPTNEVSPNYFDVFGVRVERGRAFTATDADCVAGVCPVILS